VPGTGGISGSGGVPGIGGGSGGITGMGGVTGSGGILPPTCNSQDFCGSLCGNDVRDTCANTPPIGANCRPPFGPYTEPCDGTDLGGATCTSLGYGSGTLSCTSTCELDTTACSDCVVDPRVPICTRAPSIVPGVTSSTPVLSATPNEIGVVWAPDGNGTAYLTLLSPSFTVLSQTEILPKDRTATPSAIAPLGSGWVTASYSGLGIVEVQLFDANGVNLGALTAANVGLQDWLSFQPALVADPNGGALVWWQLDGAVWGALIAADGTSVSTPQMLLSAERWLSATFADGAFYFLDSIQSSSSNSLVRVETDGTVASPIDILPGIGSGNMMLVPGAPDLRVVYPSVCGGPYCGTFNGLVWQKLTSTGDAVAPPVTLTSDSIAYTTAIGFGEDTLIAFTASHNYPAPSSLSLMHIDSNGAPVEPTFSFFSTPIGAQPFALASTGSDVVAAFSVDYVPGMEFVQIMPGTRP
jgi:hypothetical protein